MTLAYFCVFIATLLPIFCAGYAKKSGGFTVADNRNPRSFLANTEGASARANAAQQNSFEALMMFAPIVIIAHLTEKASQLTINFWAIIFILSRIVYIYMYIKDKPAYRSLSWFVGALSLLALMIAAF